MCRFLYRENDYSLATVNGSIECCFQNSKKYLCATVKVLEIANDLIEKSGNFKIKYNSRLDQNGFIKSMDNE